MLKVKD